MKNIYITSNKSVFVISSYDVRSIEAIEKEISYNMQIDSKLDKIDKKSRSPLFCGFFISCFMILKPCIRSIQSLSMSNPIRCHTMKLF